MERARYYYPFNTYVITNTTEYDQNELWTANAIPVITTRLINWIKTNVLTSNSRICLVLQS